MLKSKNIKHFLLIECLSGMIFCLLVTFLFDENIAKVIVPLYGIVWLPAMFLSTKIYNNIIDSVES
jgi:hypothetical protein